jgi:hypothetical protein
MFFIYFYLLKKIVGGKSGIKLQIDFGFYVPVGSRGAEGAAETSEKPEY